MFRLSCDSWTDVAVPSTLFSTKLDEMNSNNSVLNKQRFHKKSRRYFIKNTFMTKEPSKTEFLFCSPIVFGLSFPFVFFVFVSFHHESLFLLVICFGKKVKNFVFVVMAELERL